MERLRNDPTFRERVRAAVETVKVPYRIYMGAAQPGPGEPLYTPYDRDLVEGWNAWSDLLCPGCDQPRDQAWSRDEDYRWKGELKLCRPCEALDEVWADHLKKADSNTEVATHGMKRVANRGDKRDPLHRL